MTDQQQESLRVKDDGWFGPFTTAPVTKEFNNPRNRIGVFSKNGKLAMHFECQEDADRHAKWWNKIHDHALTAARQVPGFTHVRHKPSNEIVAAFKYGDMAEGWIKRGYQIGHWQPEELEIANECKS